MGDCSHCGGLVGGEIHMDMNGPKPLSGRCICGKRHRINVRRSLGFRIGGDQ